VTAGQLAFAPSAGLFAGLVSWLGGAQAASLEHGDLEEELGSRARELTRQLMQDHLDPDDYRVLVLRSLIAAHCEAG